MRRLQEEAEVSREAEDAVLQDMSKILENLGYKAVEIGAEFMETGRLPENAGK